jgi:hypothetical protein
MNSKFHPVLAYGKGLSKMFFQSFLSATIVGTSLLFSNSAKAELYLRSFNLYFDVLTGGSFRANLGQKDLTSPGPDVTPANQIQHISKEMWLMNLDSEWVEMGAVKGWTSSDGMGQTTYWAGSFYATQSTEGGTSIYRREYVKPWLEPDPGQPVTYEARYGGSADGHALWDFYINGAIVDTLPHANSYFSQMQVGIETNSDCNSFVPDTKADNMQYRGVVGDIVEWKDTDYPVFRRFQSQLSQDKIDSWNVGWDSDSNTTTFYRDANWSPSYCP